MLEKGKEVIEYDIRGQICPSTLLIALREVNRNKERLKSGELMLRFKTDNRDATVTIPDSVEDMGYGAVVSKESDYYVIVISCNGSTDLPAS
jgi:TusA-related sulfurtransferase